mmetsp:Transcript_94403/g.224849  ORF Transcript_94403/g.224849 Transcript_94403/m.224849 type:complete len:269 (+) Transcript_94403:148-954(+)
MEASEVLQAGQQLVRLHVAALLSRGGAQHPYAQLPALRGIWRQIGLEEIHDILALHLLQHPRGLRHLLELVPPRQDLGPVPGGLLDQAGVALRALVHQGLDVLLEVIVAHICELLAEIFQPFFDQSVHFLWVLPVSLHQHREPAHVLGDSRKGLHNVAELAFSSELLKGRDVADVAAQRHAGIALQIYVGRPHLVHHLRAAILLRRVQLCQVELEDQSAQGQLGHLLLAKLRQGLGAQPLQATTEAVSQFARVLFRSIAVHQHFDLNL